MHKKIIYIFTVFILLMSLCSLSLTVLANTQSAENAKEEEIPVADADDIRNDVQEARNDTSDGKINDQAVEKKDILNSIASLQGNGTSSFVRIREIFYPSWLGNWSTYMGTIDGKIAYCLEASKNTPENGNYAAQVVDNDNLLKVLYYGYAGPGQSVFLGEKEDIAYLYTHILASYAYSGDLYGGHGFDYWEQHGIGLRGEYDRIQSFPSPKTLQFSNETLTATYDANTNTQRTNTITLQAVSRVAVNIPLQDGVTLHNVSTGAAQTGGVATIRGQESFYLESSRFDLESEKLTNLSGENLYRYAPIAFSPGGSYQSEGTITISDVISLNLSINWTAKEDTWILHKEDEEGNPVAGATYALYIADDRYNVTDKTPVLTSVTDQSGDFVVDPNKNKKLSLSNLYLNSRYYVLKETNTPNGFQTSQDVHLFLKGDQSNPYFIVENPWQTGAAAKLTQSVKVANRSEIEADQKSYPHLAILIKDKQKNKLIFKSSSGQWRYTMQTVSNSVAYQEALAANPIYLSLAQNVYIGQIELPVTYALTDDRYETYAMSCNDQGSCQLNNRYTPDEIQITSKIILTNKKNKFKVEKADSENGKLKDAEFSLYEQENVSNQNGSITIINDKPYEVIKTDSNGIAIFGVKDKPLLSGKTYYLKETQAPQGYVLNSEIIEIAVTDNGIYANAKKADDGIRVKKSIGNVISLFQPFAEEDGLDPTLNGIKMKLETANTVDGVWDRKDAETHMRYSRIEGRYEVYSGNAYMDTDTGFSRLHMEQCLDHPFDSEIAANKQILDKQNLSSLFSENTVIQVINQKVTTLEIKKEVIGETTSEAFSFMIMLQDAEGKPSTKTYMGSIYNADGTIKSNVTITGSKIFSLKHKEKLILNNIDIRISYSITELAPPPQYIVSIRINQENVYNSNSAKGDVSPGENQILCMNTRKEKDNFEFIKSSKNGIPLSGAGFVLYELNCDQPAHDHTKENIQIDKNGNLLTPSTCWSLKERINSSEDGSICFKDLPIDKEYRLIEYKAPPGYLLPDGQWKIAYDNKEMSFTVKGIVGSITQTPAFEKLDHSSIAYRLPNYQAQDLPSTGYEGSVNTHLIGGFLMMLSICIYLRCFRWRNKV